MQHRASLLDALVVAAGHDAAVDHEHRPDGDAAGGEPLASFIDGSAEEGIHE